MEKYDAAIIGAGLGGLECAYILAKRGRKVVVLEKNSQYLGGCLQTFKRGGNTFDTGFHYVGGLDDGQPLNKLFKRLNLMELPWVKMDEECFDEVVYQGKSYKIPQGFDRFRAQMKEYFPESADEIDTYTAMLKDVADNLLDTFVDNKGAIHEHPLFVRKALDYLNQTISNPVLRNVLSGTSPKLMLHANLPLYVFAQINASFINSAYRMDAPGMAIADHLAGDIISCNGVIMKGAEVTRLEESDHGTKILSIDGKDSVEADVVISNIHPARLSEILPGTIAKKYSRRVKGDQSFGMFTVNIALKPGAVRYLNRNIYIHNTDDIWTEASDIDSSKPGCVLISFRYSKTGYAEYADILTPMSWNEVERFDDGSAPMRRSREYEDFKKAREIQLIDIASRYVPGLKDAISYTASSTPLTYKYYTGTECGAAYGINIDSDKLLNTMPAPKVADGIYHCGQNTGLHGILGVTMTACIACQPILQEENLLDIFENKN